MTDLSAVEKNVPILSVEHLKKNFGEHEVLRDITFDVPQGDVVSIIGSSGSGKSTLLRCINFLEEPTDGRILFRGKNAETEWTRAQYHSKVGMVFQNPDNQIVSSIVEEDVAFGVENLGVEPKECRRRVDAALKTVGMYAERLKSPSKLSGGQKQRVAVAGIIAMRPLCIVLDEPTAMLDPSGRREVLDTVKKLNKEEGITILLITHYMDEAVQADRVVVMDDGVIRLDGAPRAVFAHVDELKALGLDVPQATELADRLGFAEHAVLNTAECVDVLISNLEEQKLGCTDL